MRSIRVIAIFISFFFLFNAEAQKRNKQILLKIEGEKTTADDFMRFYNKSYNDSSGSQQTSIKEYLDLYINYRLKVLEAKSLRMDTISQLKDEFDGYSKKLAEPYFFDKKTNEYLINEAYQRLLKDVRVSHILVGCNENANPADTLKAYQKIIELRQKALKGEDFNQLAKIFSEDLSARDQTNNTGQIIKEGNVGDLGYFSIFDMVYPFENEAYNIPLGKISQPIRTRFGYHILKPTDRHEALGKVTVAHIFLASPKSSPSENNQKNKIFEIYKKLQSGSNFEKLVVDYSEDLTSKTNNGILPTFGANEIVPEFYLAIFTINAVGGYSSPIKTPYGWHIIKLIEQNKPGSFADERTSLLNKIKNDKRSELSKMNRLEFIKETNGFKTFAKAKDELFQVMDSTLLNGDWDIEKAKGLNHKLFKIGKQFATQQNFAQFIKNQQKKSSTLNLESQYQNLYHNFVNKVCEAYFYDYIKKTDPEFRDIIKEYSEGVLLFELMNEKVWGKSMNDETALTAYFKLHQSKYPKAELNEIKGIVISDYQKQLEEDWIKELRTKYSVKINKHVLSQIL